MSVLEEDLDDDVQLGSSSEDEKFDSDVEEKQEHRGKVCCCEPFAYRQLLSMCYQSPIGFSAFSTAHISSCAWCYYVSSPPLPPALSSLVAFHFFPFLFTPLDRTTAPSSSLIIEVE